MAKSNAAETAILELIFNATTWNGIAEDDTTSPETTITLALHTSDPGEAGTMSTNECTYGGYARITAVRTSSGWTVAGAACTNAAQLQFAEATSGTETITHMSAGFAGGTIIYRGAVSPNISVVTTVVPTFPIGNITFTES